jgi:hypothetical protein
MINSKICTKCGCNKLLSEFNNNKRTKDGLTYYCKECTNKIRKDYYFKNSESEKEKYRKYYYGNPEKIKETEKKYYRNNIDKIKEYHLKTYDPIKAKEKNKIYREENPDKERNRKKEYVKKNRDKVNEYAKQYRKTNNYKFAYRYILINTLRRFGKPKENKTINLLGYSALELKEHIQSLFTDGMTWDNYGEWHIDHIIPVSSFDQDSNPSIVNALSNLQPLWATTREINGVVYIGNLNKSNFMS